MSFLTKFWQRLIQFLKNARVKNVQLGAGADSVYGGEIIIFSTISGGAGQDTFLISTLSNAIIYGGGDADSVSITGSLYGGTVDFGAGNENYTPLLALPTLQLLVELATTPSW